MFFFFTENLIVVLKQLIFFPWNCCLFMEKTDYSLKTSMLSLRTLHAHQKSRTWRGCTDLRTAATAASASVRAADSKDSFVQMGFSSCQTHSSRLSTCKAPYREQWCTGVSSCSLHSVGAGDKQGVGGDYIYWVLLTSSPGRFSPLRANSAAWLLPELQWLPLKNLTFTLQQ